MDKISVNEYMLDRSKLEVVYIPYYVKIKIITKTIYEFFKRYGYVNSSMVKLIGFQTYVEYITNLDMGSEDENNLLGFDILKYNNKYNDLIIDLGDEYKDFENILAEQLDDYKRDADIITQNNQMIEIRLNEGGINEGK